MAAANHFSPWHWAGFVLIVLVCLALDLGAFRRKSASGTFRESLRWSVLWLLLALSLAAALAVWRGPEQSLQFLAGYVVEYSLSLDNLFAMALIFSWFGVPPPLQHRVLFWGIIGALVMRGLMIGAGMALLREWNWLLYFLGAFLLWAGCKWGFSRQAPVQPEKNRLVRLARKFFPVTRDFDGRKFFGLVAGRRALTPLALALLTIEATDLAFATDSIPAIFAVTQDPFLLFTSNICAVLGLRSLYFVLAGAMGCFRYLKTGVALVLVFIGSKMLLSHWQPVSTAVTLAVVAGVIGVSILLSLAALSGQGKESSQ
ncbi:MAG: TerC/Alx family metal homeostasis membrane protein [Terracidiphilus sp.]|jgi:tellurite resistance protein TerC